MDQNDENIIFQEIPEDIDETWIEGSIFGGMGSVMDNFQMAKSFRKAAESLAMQYKADCDSYEILNPLLYLYRHAIELYLKEIICKFDQTYNKKKIKALGHSLSDSFLLVEKFIEARGYKIPDKLKNIVFEFNKLDKRSFRFRYGEGVQPGEYWIDFIHLNNMMKDLFDGFENIYSIACKKLQ